MPTFAEIIARPHTDALYVLRISGIPYVWSNGKIPARWGSTSISYGGETYTWLPYLRPGDSFGAVSTKIEPKGGVGSSGGQDFDLVALGSQSGDGTASTLLSLLTSSTNRTDALKSASLAMELTADLSGSQAVTLLANPWDGGTYPANLYAGTETIGISSVTADTPTTFTATLTRGRYGSIPLTHSGIVREGNRSSGGALYVAEYPLTMVGRIAQVWCCPGEWMRVGSGWIFNAYAATLGGAENKIVYAGVVDGINEDGPIVTIRTSSLDQLIKNSVIKSAPRCKLGSGNLLRANRVYIGEHNKWLHCELEIAGQVDYAAIHIPANANLTAGDTITIGATTMTAVAGAPGANQFRIGATVLVTYVNLAAALNLSFGGVTLNAYYTGQSVDLRPAANLANPSATLITITTTNPNAITLVSDSGDLQSGNLAPVRWRTLLNQALRRSQNADNQAPWEDVPEGLYTPQELSAYITDTLTEWLPRPLFIQCGLRFFYNYDEATATTRGYTFALNATITPSRQGRASRLIFFTLRDDNESFLRDLGFTELEYELTKENDEEISYEASATKPPAIFRLPPYPRRIPARIYLDSIDPWSSDWLTTAGWEDDGGNNILPHLFAKDIGILSFDTYSPTGYPYIEGVTRSALATPNAEEVYIEYNEDDPKTVEAERVIALPNVSATRMLLYLMLSGSGVGENSGDYDKGWPGCGLHIPAALVDVARFEALDASNPQPRDGWVILGSDDARKVFDEELKATQQQIVADLGVLSLISMDPPLEALSTTVHVIGPAQLVTDPDKGVGFDRQENRIVNAVQIKGDWDARDGKFWFDQTNRQQDSIGTWGEQQPISVELRGLRLGDSEARGKQIAERIFALYAQPYALIEVDIAPKAAWLWEVGDFADLTHPNVPHPTKATRGVTDMRCRIMQKSARYAGGSGKSFVTVTLQSYAYQGRRTSLWGPSCQLVYSGTANTWTRVADRYGEQIGGVDDEDYFAVSDRVKLMQIGMSTVSTKTVATKVGNDFTFSTALSGSSGQKYVMWYGDYDDAATTAAQRKYVYWSDYSGNLTSPTGTDPAFRYL